MANDVLVKAQDCGVLIESQWKGNNLFLYYWCRSKCQSTHFYGLMQQAWLLSLMTMS